MSDSLEMLSDKAHMSSGRIRDEGSEQDGVSLFGYVNRSLAGSTTPTMLLSSTRVTGTYDELSISLEVFTKFPPN